MTNEPNNLTPESLLDLIEGELPPADRARVEAMLSERDDLQRLVRALDADRSLLRGLPEPELPRDFVAALEPMLARPLLVETEGFRPGALRRERRRNARRRTLRHAAMAATWFFIVTGSIVAVVTFAASTGRWDSWVEQVAGSPEDGEAVPDRVATERRTPGIDLDEAIASGLPIHHHWRDERAPTAEVPPIADPPAPPDPEAASFALVINGLSGETLETRLSEAIDRVTTKAALVRNLTHEEAGRHESNIRAQAERAMAENANASAGTDGDRPTDPVGEPPLDRPRATGPESGIVSGLPRLMPTWEQQLEFSDSGAEYTIAVPVGDLAALLHDLHEHLDTPALLRMLERLGADSEAIAAIEERPQILAALRDLEKESSERVVWVPVVIEDDDR